MGLVERKLHILESTSVLMGFYFIFAKSPRFYKPDLKIIVLEVLRVGTIILIANTSVTVFYFLYYYI